AAPPGGPLVKAGEQEIARREAPPPRSGADHEVFFDAQRRENFALLRHPAEAIAGAPVRRNTRDVAAAPNDGAATDAGEAHDGEKERRLADAVASEHGKAAAVRHGQREAVAPDG